VVLCFSSRRRHTRSKRDWSSDVCSSDLQLSLREPAEVLLVNIDFIHDRSRRTIPEFTADDAHGFGLRWQREVQHGIEVSEHRPVQYTATVGCSNCHRSLTKHLDKQQKRFEYTADQT